MKERTMSDEIVKQLISAGLTKQQATSVTAQTLVDVLQSEDSKMLVQETKRKVDEMVAMVEDAREKHMRLVGEISQLSQSLLAIGEAQDKYGEITDEKARICVAMYGALLIRAFSSVRLRINMVRSQMKRRGSVSPCMVLC